jgi:hypothetical protein
MDVQMPHCDGYEGKTALPKSPTAASRY